MCTSSFAHRSNPSSIQYRQYATPGLSASRQQEHDKLDPAKVINTNNIDEVLGDFFTSLRNFLARMEGREKKKRIAESPREFPGWRGDFIFFT
jgi:hypothetical protein